MEYITLLTQLTKGIFTITINRPEKLNALNLLVLDELSAAIQEVYENRDIKSAVITGAGEKAFVAGADIKEFVGVSSRKAKELARIGQGLFDKIENSPKPIIAAVNGFALGGGCELAMACHIRYVASNAKFGQPEVNLGIIPGYGGTQRLTQLVGKGRAIEMIISGNMIDAHTALQYGLVNKVFDPASLMPAVVDFLQQVNNKAPLAVAKSIACINDVANGTPKGYEVEADCFAACFDTTDKTEGVNAFLEKRSPLFLGI